jgi:uncharacterized OsmC-like protein
VKLLLLSEDAIRLEVDPGPIHVESVEPDMQFSAFHMLAGSLAYCTFSVMYTWASQSQQPTDDLVLDVHWAFSDDAPRRIKEIHMTFRWPSLPEQKRDAATRVADFCPIHETLRISPVVTTAHG